MAVTCIKYDMKNPVLSIKNNTLYWNAPYICGKKINIGSVCIAKRDQPIHIQYSSEYTYRLIDYTFLFYSGSNACVIIQIIHNTKNRKWLVRCGVPRSILKIMLGIDYDC